MRLPRFLPLLLLALALPALACSVFQRAQPTEAPYTPAPRKALVFKPEKLPDGQVGAAYDIKVTIEESVTPVFDISVSEGALPAGLELKMDEADHSARIVGSPSESGSFTFTLQALCFGTNQPGQTGTKSYTLHIAP